MPLSVNWDAVSAYSEVIGAAAVVISLVYLALQIRQNTKAIRGSTLDAITAHMQEELRWSSEMPVVFKKAMEDPATLTYEEAWALSEWVTAAFTARQNEYYQYQQGMLDEEVWEGIENIIRLLMGISWIRDWWQDYGRKQLGRSFVGKVESLAQPAERDVAAELSSVFNRSGT
jgi:hypothetical protein